MWGFWREYGLLMAERQTTIWLCLVYVVLIGPTWVISRLSGKRFFAAPHVGDTYWVARPTGPRTLADMQKMG
jgi:hypothetical protein